MLLHRRPPDTSLLQPPDAVGSPRSVDGAPTAVQTCGVCVVVAVLRTPRVFAVGWAVSHHYKTVLFDLLRLGPDSGCHSWLNAVWEPKSGIKGVDMGY